MMAQKAKLESRIKECEDQLGEEEIYAEQIEGIRIRTEEKMNAMKKQVGELEDVIKKVWHLNSFLIQ